MGVLNKNNEIFIKLWKDDALPSPKLGQGGPWFLKQRNCGDLKAHSQLSQH
jgi:hypothetical protein